MWIKQIALRLSGFSFISFLDDPGRARGHCRNCHTGDGTPPAPSGEQFIPLRRRDGAAVSERRLCSPPARPTSCEVAHSCAWSCGRPREAGAGEQAGAGSQVCVSLGMLARLSRAARVQAKSQGRTGTLWQVNTRACSIWARPASRLGIRARLTVWACWFLLG